MHAALEHQRLLVVPRLMDKPMALLLYRMLLLRNWRGQVRHDAQAPTADSHWGDATLDAALLTLQPAIEQASGCRLLPTYAYARLYFRGDELARHRDRAACQIAATIHLGTSSGPAPPICFEPDIAVLQRPGDAVVYLGDRIDHWRDPFEGESNGQNFGQNFGLNFGQLFVNYVFADGDRTALVHDGRRGAFPPALSPRRLEASDERATQ